MRQAKTEAEHWLHGTKSQVGKTTTNESVYIGGRPKFPSHLSKPAKAEFKRCCQILERRGTVTPGDVTILTVYTEVYARWVAMKAEVGSEYMVEIQVTDNNGTLRTVTRLNPLLKIIQADESRLLSLAKELGLTPGARDKVRPTKAPRNELNVVPGSLGDLCPEVFEGKPLEFKLPEPIKPEDMITVDDIPQENKQDADK